MVTVYHFRSRILPFWHVTCISCIYSTKRVVILGTFDEHAETKTKVPFLLVEMVPRCSERSMVKVSLKQQATTAFQVLLWDLITVAVDVPIRNSTPYQMGPPSYKVVY